MRPFDLALRLAGEAEIPGPADHPMIQWAHMIVGLGADQPDETAWCSSFVNLVAFLTGYERSGKANARSWLEVGEEVPLDQAVQGSDVVIFWRGDPSSWKGHVAFFAGREGNTIHALGGNQGNKVGLDRYPEERLLQVRRLALA